jgi:hypothetical protein
MGVGVSHLRHDQPADREFLAVARLYLLGVTLNVWVLVGILAAAFVVQLWSGAANLISVAAEAGLHWNLPADPSGYLLFR